MWAKGPMPGATPKDDALAVLPAGTHCSLMHALGIRGYVVRLPDGKAIGSGGNASIAWGQAQSWAERQAANVSQASANRVSHTRRSASKP